jgi:hypothetical protein
MNFDILGKLRRITHDNSWELDASDTSNGTTETYVFVNALGDTANAEIYMGNIVLTRGDEVIYSDTVDFYLNQRILGLTF